VTDVAAASWAFAGEFVTGFGIASLLVGLVFGRWW
jgi:hypothetical protein